MSEFLANVSEDVLELLGEISDEMVQMFGIRRAEAVARINAQWPEQKFLEQSEIILHEDAYYWALFIYYDGQVPDWGPDADRSGWQPRQAPGAGTEFWTLGR
ncbi:hypothetical protein HUT18_21710 [Streptomyces sp. NA04227]|uniref:hypothetical protein n=1 Tax=Streptomyces sp. NA04227 TaxID=2742136 RepID=UPI001591CE62|nr:hypothetical protein [Streptomyces sp. NA04227]QKW08595.1 hypothetical protein HUT18_21710 [Streptomyces sp. NA04227]